MFEHYWSIKISIKFLILFHNRTLINSLVTSMLWIPLVWNITVQPWTLIRYFVGPMNSHLACIVDYLLRNVPLLQVNIVQNATIAVRYICIFWAKNPTAVQDDFWKIFICVWGLGFSVITEFVYIILPGRNPMNYYTCLGHFYGK